MKLTEYIKPLEWDAMDGGWFHCESPLGHTYYVRVREGAYDLWINTMVSHPAESVEAAKEKAWQHHLRSLREVFIKGVEL